MKSGKKPYHDGDLRQKLVQAGLAALKRKPADQLSLRELARDLGRAPSAPLAHFKSKDALLAALAAEGYRSLSAMTQRVAAEPDNKRHSALIEGYVGFALENRHLYALMFSAPLPERDEGLETAATESFQGLRQVLQRDGLSMDAVVSIWASLHGLVTLALSDRLKHEGDLRKRLNKLGMTQLQAITALEAYQKRLNPES